MKRTKRTIGYELYQDGQLTKSFKGKGAERQLKMFMRTVTDYDRIIQKVRQKDGSVKWNFYKTDRNVL